LTSTVSLLEWFFSTFTINSQVLCIYIQLWTSIFQWQNSE